ATHAAIGACRDDRTLRRAQLDHRFFLQGRGRTGLHAGAAADAIRGQEVIARRTGADAAVETAALDGQRERALNLFAGAHTARTDDAFRRIIGEIGVAF